MEIKNDFHQLALILLNSEHRVHVHWSEKSIMTNKVIFKFDENGKFKSVNKLKN